MLKLVNVIKDYKVGGGNVINALRGVSMEFRQSEFVSVLGPSGCGKTTLLNIIGGLDHSTTGDLLIYNKSTKEYKDRDWDVYRNHRIGFVFQSYNLIPHQTVLGNVELSLTIAGLGKLEREERAKKALDKVGLSDQYSKRPNQLSGGQCQRVAIARALVNDPEILLADEPTGALDTVTSKQIMELVKEISKERLVIMVTHNGEIAEQYSTRIIRLLDGKLMSDSNPFSEADVKKEAKIIDEKEKAIKLELETIKDTILQKEAQIEKTNQEIEIAEKKAKKKAVAIQKKSQKEKAKMSFWTAFKLSLKNLFSKKARTIMTSIAGSIGIIGVSLVLAISYGVQNYIDEMQNDMLSGNPIEIRQTAFDINALMSSMDNGERMEFIKENDYVNIDSMMETLVNRAQNMTDLRIQNKINKNYVDFVQDIPKEYLSAVFLNYGLDVSNSIYTNFKGNAADSGKDVSLTGIKAIYSAILNSTQYDKYSSMISSLSQSFAQAPDAEDYIKSQYNLEYGKIAKEKNEIMIVLGADSVLNDLLLAQLGYYSQEEFINLVYKVTDDPLYNSSLYKNKISYDNLIGRKFTWYKNDSVFAKNNEIDPLNMNPFKYNAYYDTKSEGLELKVVGILEPNDNLSFGTLSTGFYYTSDLAKYIIEQNKNSEIVNYSKTKSIQSTATFYKKGTEMPGGTIASKNTTTCTGVTFNYEYTFNGETNSDTGIVGNVDQMSTLMGAFSSMMSSSQTQNDTTIKVITLQELGGNIEDLGDGNYFALPSRIAVYPLNLDQKTFVLNYLDEWNSNKDITIKSSGVTLTPEQREHITYTDNLSVVMSMIKQMVQIITIALVGFTSLALVVSCVMIAIITYVSVVERIKEIGVIRSLGGRKRDVSNLFIAETGIIGLASGLFGIAVTYILTGIINLIVRNYAAIAKIAIFPWHYAVIMVAVSVGLTLISGLMPSRAAAKKDPVVALRTE